MSCSQKRKDLEKLADRYILDLDASVRVVVGLDIEYRSQKQKMAGSREAVFSVWRPEVIRNNGGGLELFAARRIKDQVSISGQWREKSNGLISPSAMPKTTRPLPQASRFSSPNSRTLTSRK